MKKRLKGYIRDDRPGRLRSYLSSHDVCAGDIRIAHGQGLLHYCARHGSGDMIRCLLRLECEADLQDKDRNLPLHCALQRALDEHYPLCQETFTEVVTPLLQAFPLGQDVENLEGKTGQDLLKELKSKIKRSNASEELKQKEEERKKAEEDKAWREKMEAEAGFEYEEQLPRYGDDDEDFTSTRYHEPFDHWSERMRRDFERKQQNTLHNISQKFRRDKKRKRKEDEEEGEHFENEEGGKKRFRREEDKEEKLKRAREEMRKSFKPDGVSSAGRRTDRLLAKKRRYEQKFAQLASRNLSSAKSSLLTFACIPWPDVDSNNVSCVLFCDLADKSEPSYRKYLRQQQIRWHPDKFTQKFGDHLHPDHVNKIMSRVKAISQLLNKLNSEL